MNTISLNRTNYTNFPDEYLIRAFTSPQIGNILTIFFYDKVIKLYTKMFLEFSGFELYIDDLSENEATNFLKTFHKIDRLLGVVATNQISFKENEKKKALQSVVNRVAEKVNAVIEKLEDKVFANYGYEISVNYADNDWNSPENDHWDNY